MSMQKARRSISELKEKSSELEKDMETHRCVLAAAEADLRDANIRIQGLTKKLNERDEEAKGLCAKITVLEKVREESVSDTARIRKLTLALDTAKEETQGLKDEINAAQTNIAAERQAKWRAEAALQARILKAKNEELGFRTVAERLEATSAECEGLRSQISELTEDLKELHDLQDEKAVLIKNQARELRGFEIVKMEVRHAKMALEMRGRMKSSFDRLSELGEQRKTHRYEPSEGSIFGEKFLSLGDELSFENLSDSDGSGPLSPAMTDTSSVSSRITMGLKTHEGRANRESTSIQENEFEKCQDEPSCITTSTTEGGGQYTCTKDDGPSRPNEATHGEDESQDQDESIEETQRDEKERFKYRDHPSPQTCPAYIKDKQNLPSDEPSALTASAAEEGGPTCFIDKEYGKGKYENIKNTDSRGKEETKYKDQPSPKAASTCVEDKEDRRSTSLTCTDLDAQNSSSLHAHSKPAKGRDPNENDLSKIVDILIARWRISILLLLFHLFLQAIPICMGWAAHYMATQERETWLAGGEVPRSWAVAISGSGQMWDEQGGTVW